MLLVEAYVAELGAALRGPRAAKRDLLTEARDGLVDATEAYAGKGLDLERAQAAALADFGTVPQVAADFQAELGIAQARRTGVLICVVLALQPVAWHLLGRVIGGPEPGGELYLLVNEIVRWTGIVAIAGALAAVVALGRGYPLIRPTGIFALAVCGVCGALGVLLTVVSPATGPLLAWGGLPSTAVLLGLPLTGIALAGRACLAATPDRVAAPLR